MVSRSVGLALIFLFTSSSALAQYASVADAKSREEAEKGAKLKAARDSLINSHFWVVPNPKATLRLEFQETPGVRGSAFVVV